MIKVSYIQHVKGHKNSKGELAEWVIKDHTTDEILSSHKTKEDARKHLQQMEMFKSMKSGSENSDEIESTLVIKEVYSNDIVGKIVVTESSENGYFISKVKDVELLGDQYNDITPEIQEIPAINWRLMRSFLDAILAARGLYLELI